MQAIANLESICARYLKDGHKLEVVDVLGTAPRDGRRCTRDTQPSKPSPQTAARVVA
jgi:hypothetical protein